MKIETVRRLFYTCIGLAIVLAGVDIYDATYTETKTQLEEKDAVEDYEEFMEDLEKISFRKDKDLSRQIYNKTDINVGSSEFYKTTNEELLQIDTSRELEKYIYNYLREYLILNNKELNKEEITFQEDGIYYKNIRMDLDPDSEEVFGHILNSLVNMNENMTEKERVDSLKKDVIITELYETKESTVKKLVLEPRKREEI